MLISSISGVKYITLRYIMLGICEVMLESDAVDQCTTYIIVRVISMTESKVWVVGAVYLAVLPYQSKSLHR